MYIKKTDSLITYPYTLDMLKHENINVSFPDVIDNSILEIYYVYPVIKTDKLIVTNNKKVIELYPEQIDGVYYQKWEIINKTKEEIEEEKKILEQEIIKIRDNKLTETDWIVLKSIELGLLIPEDWLMYRQELRNIPLQYGYPYNVKWPIIPNNTI